MFFPDHFVDPFGTRDDPNTTTTIFEFFSRGPIFHFWGTPGCHTKCSFYTVEHHENTNNFHLICHDLPV